MEKFHKKITTTDMSVIVIFIYSLSMLRIIYFSSYDSDFAKVS